MTHDEREDYLMNEAQNTLPDFGPKAPDWYLAEVHIGCTQEALRRKKSEAVRRIAVNHLKEAINALNPV